MGNVAVALYIAACTQLDIDYLEDQKFFDPSSAVYDAVEKLDGLEAHDTAKAA